LKNNLTETRMRPVVPNAAWPMSG